MRFMRLGRNSDMSINKSTKRNFITYGCDVQLRGGDRSTNRVGDFGRTLDAQADVPAIVSNGNERLEASALTGARLLLDRHDLHDFILKLVLQEVVNDLSLLHREREKEDLFNASNLSFLHKTPEFGYWNPNVLISTTPSATSTAAAATATATASSFAAAEAASSTASAFAGRRISTLLS